MIKKLLPAILMLSPIAAYADVNNLPADTARPGWRPPTAWSYVPAGGAHFDFDPCAGPIPLERLQAEDDIWLVGPGEWGASPTPLPLPTPPVGVTCRPPVSPVPGPLPVLGLAAAFGWSRRLRRRVGK